MINVINDVVKKFFQVLVRFPLHLGVLLLWFAAVNWGITYIALNHYVVSRLTGLIALTLTGLAGVILVSLLIDLVEHRAFSVSRVISRFTLFRIINFYLVGLVISLPLLLIGFLMGVAGIAAGSDSFLLSAPVNLFMRFGNLLFIMPLTAMAQAAIIKDNLRVDIALDRSLSLLLKNIVAIVIFYALLAAPQLLADYVTVPATILPVAQACWAIIRSLIGVILYVTLSKRS